MYVRSSLTWFFSSAFTFATNSGLYFGVPGLISRRLPNESTMMTDSPMRCGVIGA